MEKERRAFRRFTLNQFIQISAGREQFINAKGINISKVGMLCESEEDIEPYSRFYLLLTLKFEDGEKTIELEGIVVHTKKTENSTAFGVRFTDVPPESQAVLDRYIAERSEE